MFEKFLNQEIAIIVAHDYYTIDGGTAPRQYNGKLISVEDDFVCMEVVKKREVKHVYINKKFITTFSINV
ncbi:MAG: hypothetical protein IJ008_00955 [Clostridia bacterium]|nr:hypothetical protein [Clostridia bacterium]